MHGGSKRFINERFRLMNSTRIPQVHQGSDDLANSLVDAFNDGIALRIVCSGGHIHNSGFVQQHLKVGSHKFWSLVMYAP